MSASTKYSAPDRSTRKFGWGDDLVLGLSPSTEVYPLNKDELDHLDQLSPLLCLLKLNPTNCLHVYVNIPEASAEASAPENFSVIASLVNVEYGFGPVFTVTNAKKITRKRGWPIDTGPVWTYFFGLSADCEEFQALHKEHFYVSTHFGGNILSTFVVKLNRLILEKIESERRTRLADIKKESYFLFTSSNGMLAKALGRQGEFWKEKGHHDRRFLLVQSYNVAAKNQQQATKKSYEHFQELLCGTTEDPPSMLKSFFSDHISEAIRKKNFGEFYEMWLQDEQRLNKILFKTLTGSFKDRENKPEEIWLRAYDFLAELYSCLVLDPTHAECGFKRCFFDRQQKGVTGIIRSMPINLNALKNSEDAVHAYGLSIARENPNMFPGVDQFIGPDDFPVTQKPEDVDPWKQLNIEGTVEEYEDTMRNYCREAVSLKRWTIPDGAIIEMHWGPFIYAEVYEENYSVDFVFRTAGNRFHMTHLSPVDEECIGTNPNYIDVKGDESLWKGDEGDWERVNLVRAAWASLLAALVRDFWVVEEREQVFSTKREKLNKPKSKKQEPRIIYLPRREYKKTIQSSSTKSTGDGEEKAIHHVRSHLRKVAQASAFQRELARRYGVELPDGYTWVRPHFSGTRKQEAIYRSRSAMKMLFGSDVGRSATGEPVKWFQFEKDIQRLLDSQNFVTESQGPSRDGGKDILATKGDQEWVIQCKCWSKKVPPAVLRELLGTMKDCGDQVKGLCVTTSSFTSDAREFAKKHQIVCWDGKDLGRIGLKVGSS